MATSCLVTAFQNTLLEERWGKDRVTGRLRRRRRYILDNLKEKRKDTGN